MGKSRRNRGGATRRRDPLSKPVKPPSDPELAALREQKILPVVKDLQSSDPKLRSSAASAISNIIQDSRCRKLLLREQVVHTILTQTLTDSALESRAAGWGILQVLAQEEEPDFCVHLFRQDIVTAMEYASKLISEKLSHTEPKFESLSKAEKTFIISIAASLVSLATALAEAQDEILEAVSANSAITSLLFGIISRESQPDDDITSLRSDALACLMILTEDNTALAEKIISKHQSLYDSLRVLRKESSGDGTLACGILHNIFVALQGRTVDLEIVDDSTIIPSLAKVVSEINPTEATSGEGWSNPRQYQQLALEILASIGTSIIPTEPEDTASKKKGPAPPEEEDDEDEHMDEDENENDEAKDGEEQADDEMDEDEMQADMEMVTGAEDEDLEGGIDDLPILQALLRDAMPEIIRAASIQVSDSETMQLQGLALSALNNAAWSVSVVDFADENNTGIQKAWDPIGRSIWKQVIAPILSSDTADVDLATQITSLAWAVARSLRDQTPLDNDEHRKFITLYQATRGTDASQDQEDPFQGLGVKCIGVLGQLALDPAPIALNREIGTFLTTVVASLPETPAADAVEALNQLFDIYADETLACDKEVFWKDGFLKHLEDALPKTRAMVKAVDKRKHEELRSRADEAVLNLNKFLAYKRKHKPQV